MKQKIANKLYHVTTKESADHILNEGLFPQIGDNSRKAGEEDPVVFLCNRKDILYWMYILGCDTVLEIEMTDLKTGIKEYRDYGLDNDYGEYLYRNCIPADHIRAMKIPVDKNDQIMRKLCFLYIANLSYFIANSITRTYAYDEIYGCDETNSDYIANPEKYANISPKDIDYINSNADILLTCLSHFDFEKLTKEDKKEIRHWLVNEGDSGEYTLFDEYFDTGNKLWEQMVLFKKDETFENRHRLYDFINKNLKFCHRLSTGGFSC